MIYIRGSRYDYDTWRDEYGCQGWGYTGIFATQNGGGFLTEQFPDAYALYKRSTKVLVPFIF